MSEELNDMLPENWKDILPDDIKNNGVLNNVTSLSQMAKMTIDARQYGSTSIRIPSEDASQEDKDAFKKDIMTKIPDLMMKPDIDNQESFNNVMKTLGAPDDVAGYSTQEVPDAIKDNVTLLSEKALEAGLTKNQFSTITDGIISDYKNNTEQAYGRAEEQKTALKTEWGAAYDEKIETISHFAKQTGFSEDFVHAIQDGHVDKTNLQAFETVIKGYEGGAIEIGRQATNPAAKMTPAEADAQLNELMGNKNHAFWHPEDPAHQSAKDKVIELGKLAETGELTEAEQFRQSLMGG